ncbi:thioesterase [Bacillus sp. FJAT-42376]|uniref:thioesterase family protein n=1 Tax=Bacillus sp. FJAT-42376 TaxID=2014076 RepID=UPI000F50BC11|nr:thioesterase [Bacillus sp. FJAT-42376]AZB41444.1 thioesterase [Bacillus sp. FJAT-42376]
MKKGMEIGCQASCDVTVTPDLFAQFEGKVVHPVYSTVSMVHSMEWASRKIILPFLEEGEEGMGASVQVKHIGPAGEGAVIRVVATLVKKEKNLVYTEVEAFTEARLIGKGEVIQIILPKTEIQSKIEQAVKGETK